MDNSRGFVIFVFMLLLYIHSSFGQGG
jgi:hypothetical protein